MSGKGKGVVIEEIVEDDVLDEQHMREGKGVVIEEIVEDDGLAEDTNVCTPSVTSSIGENLNLIDSDDDLLIDCSRWSDEEKLKLSQDALEMPSGMEGDLPTWVEDEDDTIIDMEGDWILDSYHNVDDGEEHIQDLFYEIEQAYEDVVEQMTDLIVYEGFGDPDLVEHATNPVVYIDVGEREVVEGLGKKLIERSDSENVISKSIRKRKRLDQDEISCGYAPIRSERKMRRLNQEEIGG
ncbi:hypothetical protein Tco_1237373 [Tanacetum coccineum]